MEVGNKVTTDTWVVLEAKLQEADRMCINCYFSMHPGCAMSDHNLDLPCWDGTGKDLIFVKAEGNE